MKALNLLREYQYADEVHGLMNVELSDAITELEEMMRPKTCNCCKYCKEDSNDTSWWTYCTKQDSPMTFNSLTDEHGNLVNFGCIYYEPKE